MAETAPAVTTLDQFRGLVSEASPKTVFDTIRKLAYRGNFREITLILKSRTTLLTLREDYEFQHQFHNEAVFWTVDAVWALCEGDWFKDASESHWVAMASNLAVKGTPDALATFLFHPSSVPITEDLRVVIRRVVSYATELRAEFAPAQNHSQIIRTRCDTILSNINILEFRLALLHKSLA